jgi:prepilin-type N-terminal cleavage/methylation domain-containing protein
LFFRCPLRAQRSVHPSGYTLLELACAIVVIGILATLALPWFGQLRAKADLLKCATNLKALGRGAAAYLDEYQKWPQIRAESGTPSLASSSTPDSPSAQWIAALSPYGLSAQSWRCPTTERQIRRAGGSRALEMTRIDYSPTRFAPSPQAPWEYSTHPWFVERGSVHGKGPLIYLADGRVLTFEDLFSASQP